MKLAGLTKSFIDGNVMNAGDAKTAINSGAQKALDKDLSAEPGHSSGGWG
jgi:hypothetical protein